jgi:predicted ATPase
MLIEFRVANHRSIRDEQVFTMEGGRTSDSDARRVAGYRQPLLTVAAFYGANASGKSNLLSAMACMQAAVTDSQRFWDPEGGIPRHPFGWGDHRRQSSLYEVTFARSGVRYQYGFVIDDERVLEEWLFAWPSSRKQTWFVRENKFKFGDHLKGENRVIEQITRPNALFLSAAAQHRHPQLQEVYSWIAAMQVDGVSPRRGLTSIRRRKMIEREFDVVRSEPSSTIQSFDDFKRRSLKAWIHIADVGISDVRLLVDGESNVKMEFLHGTGAKDAWLPFEEESSGTHKWLRLGGAALEALASGTVVVVDELERNLHPLLAQHLLQMFMTPESNPNNAQIIFSTHDTTLLGTALGEPVLSRDQIWLTEKDSAGASIVYPLSDYQPRKAENVERGYLQGRYGAIPFLGPIENLIEP